MPKRLLTIVITAAIAGTPLCLMNGVFLSHDVIPKVILVMTSAACLLFLFPHWIAGTRVLRASRSGGLFLSLAVAQLASLALSTEFSTQPLLSLVGTVWRRFGAVEQAAAIVIAIATASIIGPDSRQRGRLLRAISVSGGIASIYAIAQFFGLDPFLDPSLYKIEVFGAVTRPPATMGHAIYLASWLAPIVMIAASQALRDNSGLWRRAHASVAVLGVMAVVLSGTRGAVLGLVGGAVVLVLRSPGSAVLGRRVALVGGTLIAVGTLFAVSPAGENFRHRLYQWKQDLGGPRTGVWLDSLALFRRHPWLGTGPETFAGEFRKIESVTLSRAYPDFYHETPHDVFLDAATGQGIPGLLILAGVFWVGWTGRARPGGTPAGLEAALAAILVCSLFASFSLVEFICLWTISGISAALRGTGAVDAGASSAGGAQVPATLLGGALIVLAVVLAIPDQADAQLQDAVDDKNPVAAAEALDRANRWSFGLPGYELWQSREMATLGRSLGNSAQAAAAWHKAIEASAAAETRGEERFSAELQSSILAITTGDLNRAELKARDASALAPNWYKPHLLLGQILQAEGRTQEGISEQQLALNLGAPRAR